MNQIILQLITSYSMLYNVDPKVTIAIVQQESSMNSMAVGSLGEIGLMQLRPEFFSESCKASQPDSNFKKTKASLIAKAKSKALKARIASMKCGLELFDPATNLKIGIKRLSDLQKSCKHQIDNTFIVCHNLGEVAAARIRNPKDQSYYKKFVSHYNAIKGLQFVSFSYTAMNEY